MRVLSICVALCATTSAAFGFARSRTQESGAPISWTTHCIPFHINDVGSDDLSLEEVVDSVRASFSAWQEPSCTNLEFSYEGLTNENRVGYIDGGENINVIVFRESRDTWPHQNGVIAVTTVTYCSQQGAQCDYAGAVLDADIELNGSEFTFSDTSDFRRVKFDLRNTLTHEVGHFIGLDHTPVAEATMFASAPPGERSKATLHQDDIDGACEIYPVDDESRICATPDVQGEYYIDLENPPGSRGVGEDGGCASSDAAPLGWVAGLVMLLGMRRRRRP